MENLKTLFSVSKISFKDILEILDVWLLEKVLYPYPTFSADTKIYGPVTKSKGHKIYLFYFELDFVTILVWISIFMGVNHRISHKKWLFFLS